LAEESEKGAVKIDIFGSCVSREIFNYDERHLYEIGKYFNFNSIFSQMSLPYASKISEDEVGHESRWYSRVIAADINKDALEQIAMDSPQWIVIDLMSERLALGKLVDSSGKDVCITLHNDVGKCKFSGGG